MRHSQSDEGYNLWSDWDAPPTDEIAPKLCYPLNDGQPYIEVPYYSTMWVGTKNEYEKCKDSITDHTLVIIKDDI